MHVIHWLTAALALVGVVLNIHKRATCFYVWAVTNATWAFIDWSHGLYAQAALMTTYFALSLWGIWKWSWKGEPHGKEDPL